MDFKNLSIRDAYRYSMGLFWSLVATAYIFIITFYSVAIASQRYADTILGFLMGTIVATIINDVFGSSEGSRAKGEQQAIRNQGVSE